MYLVSTFMGSSLQFHKIVENHGAWVKIDRGDNIAYRQGEYFKRIPNWETINYIKLDTLNDVMNYIKNNFDKLREWDCNYSCTEKTVEDCINETLQKFEGY